MIDKSMLTRSLLRVLAPVFYILVHKQAYLHGLVAYLHGSLLKRRASVEIQADSCASRQTRGSNDSKSKSGWPLTKKQTPTAFPECSQHPFTQHVSGVP